jgi:SAM-dependent methyltransferase
MRETLRTATGGTGVGHHEGALIRGRPPGLLSSGGAVVSSFSSVDLSPEPGRLIRFLEDAAIGLDAMKHYMATAHARRTPAAPVLDLGCGAGHDLTVLTTAGVDCVGVDPSRAMLESAARRRAGMLVRAAGEALPFADRVLAGCRIERVLMHVEDPSSVIEEVVRCVQPAGLLTIFEPDWASLTVNGTPVPTAWVSIARHPSIGSAVGELLRGAGCSILDRVEERSWWTFSEFERITDIERSLHRAVGSGHMTRRHAQRWLDEQRERAAAGDFSAEIAKVLWVATTPV